MTVFRKKDIPNDEKNPTVVWQSRRLEAGFGTSVATSGVDVEWCLLLPRPHACDDAQGNTGVIDEVATPTLAVVALPLILFLLVDLEDCNLHSHSVKKTASSCTRGELPEKWACPKLVVWAWPHSPSRIATPLKAVWVSALVFSVFSACTTDVDESRLVVFEVDYNTWLLRDETLATVRWEHFKQSCKIHQRDLFKYASDFQSTLCIKSYIDKKA